MNVILIPAKDMSDIIRILKSPARRILQSHYINHSCEIYWCAPDFFHNKLSEEFANIQFEDLAKAGIQHLFLEEDQLCP